MKVGIISDTHDRLPTLRAGLEFFRQFGLTTLIHPGDIIAPFAARPLAEYPGTVHVTYGNNDGERAGLKRVLPQIQDGPLRLELAGRRVLVHHFVDWCDATDVDWAEVVISGHTHSVTIERRAETLFLNPGECCGWVNDRCTVAILDLATLEHQLIELPT
jgi:putative phosphoesterase